MHVWKQVIRCGAIQADGKLDRAKLKPESTQQQRQKEHVEAAAHVNARKDHDRAEDCQDGQNCEHAFDAPLATQPLAGAPAYL